jgi:hypothetical protein
MGYIGLSLHAVHASTASTNLFFISRREHGKIANTVDDTPSPSSALPLLPPVLNMSFLGETQWRGADETGMVLDAQGLSRARIADFTGLYTARRDRGSATLPNTLRGSS